jgi:DeoR/GlpR family transcriptional regulator of sugar metabolism
MRYDRSLAVADRLDSLISLIRSGAYSTQVLAQRLGVSEQTVYRGIQSLKRRDYVVRSAKQASGWAYRLEVEPVKPVQGEGSSGT